MSAPTTNPTNGPTDAVRVGPRAGLVLALASVAGLVMFVWPLLLVPAPGADRAGPPFVFLALLPVVVLVVVVELTEGGMDAKALAMLGVLTARPRVVALDEPTRGLDYAAKAALARIVRGLAGDGRGVLLSTHDGEFGAQVADSVVVLAESPAFAPQVSKVLGPDWLTVDQVEAALV